jgi:predicted DNA-binding transcriptional regulator AlpA
MRGCTEGFVLRMIDVTSITRERKLAATRPPKRLHLDRRAATLAAVEGDEDELLTTQQMSDWLQVSIQWLENGRIQGYGPPFERVGPRMVRYRRSKAKAWLDERTHLRTDEYLKVSA